MTSRVSLFAAALAAGLMISAAGLAGDNEHDHDDAAAAAAAGSGAGSGSGSGMGMMRGGMMGGCPMMGGRMAGNMGMHADGRIAFLKAELAITDAQKDAFDAYAAAVRKNLDQMKSRHEAMMKVKGDGTAPERLDRHIGAMESRVASLKEMKEPLGKLYAALSGEQQKKADDLLMGMGCMM